MEPIFFGPIFKERIWGGKNLTAFGYEIPSDRTGECWAFSAHPNGPSIVKDGELKGLSLAELWQERRELFGGVEGEKFPLLTKILDANDDLSVQVHPDDDYAKKHENGELGKTECWYILDCEDGAELVYGHTAKDRRELAALMDQGKWNDLLRTVKIKKGDFFYVPSGTVHALCKGTMVLETQQNSDTTYRLYDYERKNADGHMRELHLEKSKEVITVPFREENPVPHYEKIQEAAITHFISNKYFSVSKIDLDGKAPFSQTSPFLLCSILDGKGKLVHGGKEYPLSKGDHFLLPFGFGNYQMAGKLEIIVSHL